MLSSQIVKNNHPEGQPPSQRFKREFSEVKKDLKRNARAWLVDMNVQNISIINAQPFSTQLKFPRRTGNNLFIPTSSWKLVHPFQAFRPFLRHQGAGAQTSIHTMRGDLFLGTAEIFSSCQQFFRNVNHNFRGSPTQTLGESVDPKDRFRRFPTSPTLRSRLGMRKHKIWQNREIQFFAMFGYNVIIPP